MRSKLLILCTVLALISLAGCAPTPAPPPAGPGIPLAREWLLPALGCLVPLLGLALLALAGILLWRNRAALAGKEPSAKEILQRRYARGELTKEEYQEMLQELERKETDNV